VPRVTTRTGDDGTTGLLYGGRVGKDSPVVEANGAIDEAQAAIGLARAELADDPALAELLLQVERDLWVAMAEVATPPEARSRLEPGVGLVTDAMVGALEEHIEALRASLRMPAQFALPGANGRAALLDVARTVVRRAERRAVAAGLAEHSLVVVYLNRLSDLLWIAARLHEDDGRVLVHRRSDASR